MIVYQILSHEMQQLLCVFAEPRYPRRTHANQTIFKLSWKRKAYIVLYNNYNKTHNLVDQYIVV